MAYIDCDKCYHGRVCAHRHHYHDMIVECNHHIPTADVVEVKHGVWIYKHRHRGGLERMTSYDEYGNPHTITVDNRYECDEPYCSVCGNLGGDFLNYCGNCGAKMNGERKDT